MDGRSRLGRAAEAIAARTLERNGFEVIARNFRSGRGEIDLIARRGRTVVFCEVKCRTTDHFGAPAEAVHRKKQMTLRRTAAAWLRANPSSGVEARFDVVSVIFRGGRMEVAHIPSAF
ncbi:MAG TPA: YraN family protein [Actinomycetota bacterium]|nr:YraN family protein [Actinomycetota bacterium]